MGMVCCNIEEWVVCEVSIIIGGSPPLWGCLLVSLGHTEWQETCEVSISV